MNPAMNGPPPDSASRQISPAVPGDGHATQGAGRHRRSGPMRRLLAKTGTTLLVVAALAVGHFLIKLTPDVDTSERPFLESGAVDELVDLRLFQVTALRTRVAAVVRVSSGKHDTQGKWVLVRVRLVAKVKPIAVGYAALSDANGRSFLASDRLRQPLIDGSRILQPGIPVEGEIAFEVPNDATSLSARFAASAHSHRMDSMADIVLDLPESTVWLDPEPVTLEPMAVKP